MSYLVLARKWRPQTFHDLVGQEHVRRTLENAIAQGRVAHAFLFTGVRGVGKTTSARLLAKALNCEKGPTAVPCQQCAPCRDITVGTDLDVRELDGASNNGVEEVRRLQEELPYRPTRDRFKIYIVDEVHMLSTAAWNAFLKTLEEPPPHVKFIFATTEVHKVPITILSRCQRYDFKMIPAQVIAARLRYVLEQEKIVADDGAVSLIAREAAGSMRDAMSLLDQAIAWAGDRLVGDEVARVLGVASRAVLHQLAIALVGGQPEVALRVVAQLTENGYDLSQVARDLLSVLRDLVVARVCTEPGSLLDLSDEERRSTAELASRASPDDLVRLHQGFARSFDEIARSSSPRAGLEMALVRLARRPPLMPLDDLLARLADLEKRLAGGPPGPRGGGEGGSRASGKGEASSSAGSHGASASGASAHGPSAHGPGAVASAHGVGAPAALVVGLAAPVSLTEGFAPRVVGATALAAVSDVAPSRAPVLTSVLGGATAVAPARPAPASRPALSEVPPLTAEAAAPAAARAEASTARTEAPVVPAATRMEDPAVTAARTEAPVAPVARAEAPAAPVAARMEAPAVLAEAPAARAEASVAPAAARAEAPVATEAPVAARAEAPVAPAARVEAPDSSAAPVRREAPGAVAGPAARPGQATPGQAAGRPAFTPPGQGTKPVFTPPQNVATAPERPAFTPTATPARPAFVPPADLSTRPSFVPPGGARPGAQGAARPPSAPPQGQAPGGRPAFTPPQAKPVFTPPQNVATAPERPAFTPTATPARPAFVPPADLSTRPSFAPPGGQGGAGARPAFAPPAQRPGGGPSSSGGPSSWGPPSGPPSSGPPSSGPVSSGQGQGQVMRGVRTKPGALAHDPSKPLPPPLPGVDFVVWRRLVDQVRTGLPALASVLDQASPIKLGAAGVELGFSPNSFEATRVSEPRYAEPLRRAVQSELGPEASVTITLTDEAREALTLAKIEAAELWERREAARKRVAEHPLVRAAIEELGAELRDVRVNKDERR